MSGETAEIVREILRHVSIFNERECNFETSSQFLAMKAFDLQCCKTALKLQAEASTPQIVAPLRALSNPRGQVFC
jgi:hypothetical protein